MLNETHGPNGSQSEQTETAMSAQLMPGMVAGYESDSLFQIIWRGRWLILLALIVAGGAVYAYYRLATPLYESASRILVEKPGLQPRLDVPQPVGSTSANYLQTQAGMITSRAIVTAALRDPNVLTLPTLRNVDFPAEQVIRTLSVSVGKNSDIISVVARSAYPDDAAQIVNAVVRAYIQWHEANRQVGAADLLKDLNDQLEKRYQELRAKRKEQMMFEQRNPEVVESVRGGVTSKTLELLKQSLAAARLNTIEQDSYYEGLKRFESDPEQLRQYVQTRRASAAAPMDQTERTRLQDALFAVQLQLEQFAAGGSFQQEKLLKNRETQFKEQVTELDKKFVQAQTVLAKVLSEDARARETRLSELYEKEFAKVQGLSGQDAEYAFILSECEMIQNLCDSLLKQINALDLSASFEGLSIHVLEKALPARGPVSPQLPRVIGIGLVLGLMAGVGLALLRSHRDPRLRSADEITAILGVPVLGAVPTMSRRRGIAHAQRLQLASDSREAEAYRVIRTSLLFGTPREQTTTILVTSPNRQDGKTTLVSNLGTAMAQAGLRTLIVDADLRKPPEHRIFAMEDQDRGLVDVLMGTATLDETICKTAVQDLDVLPSGPIVHNPSEMLNGRAFTQMLEQLKQKYDRILFDSAPLRLVTDSQILAAHCDLTVLVLRAEKSSRMQTQQAREALLTVGARLMGVVVNDVSKRDKRYSHWGGYGYYYGHHSSNGHKSGNGELSTGAAPNPANETAGDGSCTSSTPGQNDGMTGCTPIKCANGPKVKNADLPSSIAADTANGRSENCPNTPAKRGRNGGTTKSKRPKRDKGDQ